MKKLFVLAFAACSLAARAAVVADGDRYEDGANIVIGTYAASDNALRGLTPEIIAGGRGSELPGAPLSLLGDGAIPMPGESVSEGFEVTLADNTTLEYAWSLDNPLVIDEIRIFSCWGGGQYRNDIVVNSIQYRDSEGNWLSAVRPPAGCEYSFGWSINSAYCNVGTTADAVSRCLRIYCDGAGENLCRYATGLRIAFGYQDHGYGGFSEIEAKIHHETWHDDGGTGWFSDGDDVIKTAGAYEFSSAGRLRFSEKVHLTATDSEDVDADIGYFLPGEEYVVVPPAGEGAWTRVTVTPVEVFPFATVASVSGDVEVRVGETYTSYIFTNTSSSASITFATPGVADLLLVGGGGAGGFLIGGGGGAGAVLMEYGRPVAAGENAVSVGAGGKAVANGNWVQGGSGYDTTVGPLAAIGGGGGAGWHVGI
ncbi:MAG: hypothetical protein ILO34_03525, partial [Kiritimatiellae bacterium]|nr:hypothetical protein [Kiritimatiellia bacterium]